MASGGWREGPGPFLIGLGVGVMLAAVAAGLYFGLADEADDTTGASCGSGFHQISPPRADCSSEHHRSRYLTIGMLFVGPFLLAVFIGSEVTSHRESRST